MAEASLSGDEENYVRMSLLLTGVCPRGVRATFDHEFAPSSLGVTIKKEYNKLKDLQLKHRINRSQWKTLFPRYPGKYMYPSLIQKPNHVFNILK